MSSRIALFLITLTLTPSLALALDLNVTGIDSASIICRNITTGQEVRVNNIPVPDGDITIFCKGQGLIVLPGDEVYVTIAGPVDDRGGPTVVAFASGTTVQRTECHNLDKGNELKLRGSADQAFACPPVLELEEGERAKVVARGIALDPSIAECPCFSASRVFQLEQMFHALNPQGPLFEECSVNGAGGIQYVLRGNPFTPSLGFNAAGGAQMKCSADLVDSGPIAVDHREGLSDAQVHDCIAVLQATLCPTLP